MTAPLDLLALLPPAYRVSDAGDGRLLRLLTDALAGPYATLSNAAEAMYDDWFIGTCSPRAIALIGELVGVETDPQVAALLPTWRRYVADAAAYRRHKGGLDTLACAAAAASGWAALARLDLDTARAEDGPASAMPAALSPPFDRSPRTLASGSPGPEAETVTLFLWRLHVYPAHRLAAAPCGGESGEGRYIADPLGVERPMYGLPRTDPAAVHPITPADLPVPLTVAMLADALANPAAAGPLGPGPALMVGVHVDGRTIRAAAMVAADLADWRVDWPRGARVAVDPERGRVLVHPIFRAREVTIDRCYAAPADIGGGPYRSGDGGEDGGERIGGGGDALRRIARHRATIAETIEIADSLRYDGDVTLSTSTTLILRARAGETPSIIGDVRIVGGEGATVVIDGLWIVGAVHVEGAVAVELRDCTLRGKGVVRKDQHGGPLRLSRSILPGLHDEGDGGVAISECLSDGAIDVAGAVDIDRSTFLAPVDAGSVTARDSVFDSPLRAADATSGEVTHCYLAPGSVAPRRIACLGKAEAGAAATPRPFLVSRRYGNPGFGQLAGRADLALATGASNGWEMGCFNAVAAPLRQAALDQAIADHAPWRWRVRREFVA